VAREHGAAPPEQRVSGDPKRGAAGLQRLDAARATALKLCATTERPVLLHGDFLDKNLLWKGVGYVAIDPIPRWATRARMAGFSPPAIRPQPRSCTEPTPLRPRWIWIAIGLSSGPPVGRSCRHVRHGGRINPS